MAEMTNGRAVQLTTTPKVNAPTRPTFNGVRSARVIDNFIWGYEAYFGAMNIEEDAQKVSNASLFLKDIALVWWHRKCDDVKRGFDPVNTWDGFKSELKR